MFIKHPRPHPKGYGVRCRTSVVYESLIPISSSTQETIFTEDQKYFILRTMEDFCVLYSSMSKMDGPVLWAWKIFSWKLHLCSCLWRWYNLPSIHHKSNPPFFLPDFKVRTTRVTTQYLFTCKNKSKEKYAQYSIPMHGSMGLGWRPVVLHGSCIFVWTKFYNTRWIQHFGMLKDMVFSNVPRFATLYPKIEIQIMGKQSPWRWRLHSTFLEWTLCNRHINYAWTYSASGESSTTCL